MSPGTQEYIEAMSFYWFLKHDAIISIADIEARLQFPRDTPAQPTSCETSLPSTAQALEPVTETCMVTSEVASAIPSIPAKVCGVLLALHSCCVTSR